VRAVPGAERNENGDHNDYLVQSKLSGLRFLPILERGIFPQYTDVTSTKYQCFVGKHVFPYVLVVFLSSGVESTFGVIFLPIPKV